MTRLRHRGDVEQISDGSRWDCTSVVDAGAGDGRVAALLTRFDPTRTVYAIERDAALYAQARTNLDQLQASHLLDTTRLRLLDADYMDPRTYTDCRLDFPQVGLVFNYPDGNETRLSEFVATWAGAATNLFLLTHNRALTLDRLDLRAQADVEVEHEESWQLSVYGTRGRGGRGALASSLTAPRGSRRMSR